MKVNVIASVLSKIALLFVLSLPVSDALWNTKDYLKREHSLVKPYHSSGTNVPYWNFMGSTIISNKYVRLTPDKQGQFGAIWNTAPCFTPNWELQVHFKIYGKGKHLYGDGMALWYVKDPQVPGTAFGSREYFSGLGIFLDTYANEKEKHNHLHPYISAMVNNGSMRYEHDIDGSHGELAGCEVSFRNIKHDTYMSIRYERNVLTVSTDALGQNAWNECFKVEGLLLPTGYFFKVSAATGDLSDNHDIISVKLFQIDIDGENEISHEDLAKILPSYSVSLTLHKDNNDDITEPMSGTKLFLMFLFGLLVLSALTIVGMMVYQHRYRRVRKPFYVLK